MPKKLQFAQDYIDVLRKGDFITFLDFPDYVNEKYLNRFYGETQKKSVEDLLPLMLNELASTTVNEIDFQRLNLFYKTCIEPEYAIFKDSRLESNYSNCAPYIFALLVKRKTDPNAFIAEGGINNKKDLEVYQSKKEFDPTQYDELIADVDFDQNDKPVKRSKSAAFLETQVSTYWLEDLVELNERNTAQLTVEDENLLMRAQEAAFEFITDYPTIFRNWVIYQTRLSNESEKFGVRECNRLISNFPEVNLTDQELLSYIPDEYRLRYQENITVSRHTAIPATSSNTQEDVLTQSEVTAETKKVIDEMKLLRNMIVHNDSDVAKYKQQLATINAKIQILIKKDFNRADYLTKIKQGLIEYGNSTLLQDNAVTLGISPKETLQLFQNVLKHQFKKELGSKDTGGVKYKVVKKFVEASTDKVTTFAEVNNLLRDALENQNEYLNSKPMSKTKARIGALNLFSVAEPSDRVLQVLNKFITVTRHIADEIEYQQLLDVATKKKNQDEGDKNSNPMSSP